jgi:3-isopropylmalate/(R)-2-methylmalate dehydratase large subunit
MAFADEQSRKQAAMLDANCREFGVPFYGLDSPFQGIMHVIGPELGLTQPGMTIVAGDSHTATHGAFGALAFGIGTSEVEHVLATQALLQHKPKACEVNIEGQVPAGVTAKDIILALIAQIGVDGGAGYAFEFTGSAIRALNMDQRMTVCNMSIEAGARAGMIAPDETTYAYLSGRSSAPQKDAWERALASWRSLSSEEGATYDKVVHMDGSVLAPMVTYGTNPSMAMPITGLIPDPAAITDLRQRKMLETALAYMGLTPGMLLLGHPVDVVFIGSCTNGRLDDLRLAASVLKGRKVSDRVRTLVVPGSLSVKRQAEADGLDRVFLEAGAEWREPGCSMCLAMNGDQLAPGQLSVSTTNRNFENRQGQGGRTILASPLTAAAAAVNGVVSDFRTMPV